MESPKMPDNALGAYMAKSLSDDTCRIASIASRLQRLRQRLAKYYFPFVAQPLAGLLTRPENHTATVRIESLIHLSALACRGTRKPNQRQLREWLNDFIRKDDIGKIEDPVDDVCVSNLVTTFGNARLFQGRWQSNDYYVQTCLDALYRLKDYSWAGIAIKRITAILRISELVAQRANVERYTNTESVPQQFTKADATTVANASSRVTIRNSELAALGISYLDIEPFVFKIEHARSLYSETLGHTTLERHPLLRIKEHTIVSLPTAIGSAIRRFLIDQSIREGNTEELEAAIEEEQLYYLLTTARAWKIRIDPSESCTEQRLLQEYIGTFDEGSFVHLLFASDSVREMAQTGLQGINFLKGTIDDLVEVRTKTLSSKPGYRRGLTIVVHGGLGRGFSVGFGEAPRAWHRLCISIFDFILLGSDIDFSALRAWKLLDQETVLAQRDVLFSNFDGFINYYAYRNRQGMEVVPRRMNSGIIHIGSDLTQSLRKKLRDERDHHAVFGPDSRSWVEVMRVDSGSYFQEAQNWPVFVSYRHLETRELLACTETNARPWWVHCTDLPESKRHVRVVSMVWEMVTKWLVRFAPLIEEEIAIPFPGPITVLLEFPDIENFSHEVKTQSEEPCHPSVRIDNLTICVSCSTQYLYSFIDETNIGEVRMLTALLKGVHLLIGLPMPSDDVIIRVIKKAIRSEYARFIHMTPGRTHEDVLFSAVSFPEPRLLTWEDAAWSHFGLAEDAGWKMGAGVVSIKDVAATLNAAVDVVWSRIRERLLTLERRSVIQKALLNFEAIRKDRREWRIAAAALCSICGDEADAIRGANMREAQRSIGGLASRVISEMALCTSPLDGLPCTSADLEYLIAEVATLLECAGQSDSAYFGLNSGKVMVYGNGNFGFSTSLSEMLGPYVHTQGKRSFQKAAAEYGLSFAEVRDGSDVDCQFRAAFASEFGISMEQFGEFIGKITERALSCGRPYLWIPKAELIESLRDLGVTQTKRAIESFILAPRPQWDERKPRNAKMKDWYPWRYNRRLSISRRPLLQLSEHVDAEIFVMPTLLCRTFNFLCQAVDGRLPGDLFDSKEMVQWTGYAAHRNGRRFARKVADRLKLLDWNAECEISMTRVGGGVELGDIDVLAWRDGLDVVWAIECKSLVGDRTPGEVGERLREYTSGVVDGERTPLQKHLDRVEFLMGNGKELSRIVNISESRIVIRSGLVTERVVPMQFSGAALEMLDAVVDYEILDSEFRMLQ